MNEIRINRGELKNSVTLKIFTDATIAATYRNVGRLERSKVKY